MRLLVTIAHYFKQQPASDWNAGSGSARGPFAKIAALNAQIVALHRYFGPYRLSINRDHRPSRFAAGQNTLDIVVITARGANLLEWIGIDPSTYTVVDFEGEPGMLPFEAQRIMRERAGGYDFYAYFEDDLIIDDPAYFAKVGWFAGEFGPGAMLVPARFEMAHRGTLAKVAIGMRLSRKMVLPLRGPNVPESLVGAWHGCEHTFQRADNPHSGCFAVTDAQLKWWIRQPSFYDRDTSWGDPLVSAATYAPAKVFGLYGAVEPDPWFLEIEHYGTRYAMIAAAPGEVFGEPPLLALAEAAAVAGAAGIPQALAAMAGKPDTINALAAQAAEYRHRFEALRNSRTKLAAALASVLWRKLSRRR
jgi:hypothetical protein